MVDTNHLINYFKGHLSEQQKAEIDEWINRSPENLKILENSFISYQLSADMHLYDSLDVDMALARFKVKLKNEASRTLRKRRIKIMQKVAAGLLIPVLILTGYFLPRFSADKEPSLVNVIVNPGIVTSFFLPDSTEVWLNSGTKLSYPSDYHQGNRWVTLDGEGLFDVKKGGTPFIVKLDSSYSIHVLGTIFNVEAYSGEGFIKTTLLEGCVKLSFLSEKKTKKTSFIKERQTSFYTKGDGKMKIMDDDPEGDVAWKDGVLIFDNHPMHYVLNVLSRYYNVSFKVLDDQILKSSITGKFDNESLFQILNYIEVATKIKYKVENKSSKSKGVLKNEIILFK